MYQTDSSVDHEDLPSEDVNIRKLAKALLLKRIFVGRYQERRYVDSLGEYRDVIRIDDNESSLLAAVAQVKLRIENHYKCWVGITEPKSIGAPAGTCLWVELPDQILGKYWFMIRSVKFKDNEIAVRLTLMRKTDCPGQTDNTGQLNTEENDIDLSRQVSEVLADLNKHLNQFFTNILTIDNIKSSLTYICALLVTLVVALINVIPPVLNYILKFLREFTYFVKAFSPMVISVINGFVKLGCSLFYLIYMLAKGDAQPRQYARPAINYNRQYALPDPNYDRLNRRALPYNRGGVKIVEL